jgi:hypothetical protein
MWTRHPRLALAIASAGAWLMSHPALAEERDGSNSRISEDTPLVANCVEAWEKQARDLGHAARPHQFVVEVCECSAKSLVDYINAHGHRPVLGGEPELDKEEIAEVSPQFMKACGESILPKYQVAESPATEKAVPTMEPDKGSRVRTLRYEGTTEGFSHGLGLWGIRSFDDCEVHEVSTPSDGSGAAIEKVLGERGINVRVVASVTQDRVGSHNVDVEEAVSVSRSGRQGSADSLCLIDLGQRSVEGVITDFSEGNAYGSFSVHLASGQTLGFAYQAGAVLFNGRDEWPKWVMGKTPVTVIYRTMAVGRGESYGGGEVFLQPLSVTTH